MDMKKLAGDKAATYVKDGMVVGLGTGSTAYHMVNAVGEMVKNGLKIQAIPTSKATEAQARELGIPLLTIDELDHVDLAIDGVDEIEKITYTDYVGIMMSSVTTIINAITYVLIAFVAVSLIVSSIMIGVITNISVLERTKEIGVLRAVGASKADVARVFNAETFIIGLLAGLFGIGITLVMILPINLILHHFTGIAYLNAILPPEGGAVLVLLSMLLTVTAGLIPARSASKKDPVVSLRSE